MHARLLTYLLVALLTATPLSAQETDAGAQVEIVTAPVELDGRVLFRVRGVSSFPADTRARLIQERLRAVAADREVSVDSLRVVEDEGVTRIVAGNAALVSLADADARLEQVDRRELANAHLVMLRQAIVDFRAARTPAALLTGAAKALIATLIFVASLVVLERGWQWVNGLLKRRLQARLALRVQSLELMSSDRIWNAIHGVLLLLRTIVAFAAGVVFLSFVLAQFPWSRPLAPSVVGFVLAPIEVLGTGVLAAIPSLVFLAVLILLFRAALRLIRLYFEALEHRTITLSEFDPDWSQPTYNIVRIAVIAFGVIVAYPYIPGSESDAFKGVSLFVGLLLSLGASSTIANLYAGYTMIYRRAFKVGDRVKVGDTVGDVIETRIQVTRLRSVKNEIITIPNSQILSSEVLNYSALAQERGLVLHTEVGIGYDTPWRQVEAMLLMAAARTPGLATQPGPFVLEKALGDFSVTYELNVYCDNVPRMAFLYAELHRQILDVFNEHGVQIMTPAYEGDPEAPKIVPPERWHATPAERLDGDSQPLDVLTATARSSDPSMR